MARGWESKAVEAQVEEASEKDSKYKKRPTPAEVDSNRKRKSLLLSRARILRDLEQNDNPRYKKILTDALADLDQRLAQLD